ncbi:MAG: alpha-galactosidase [Clostridia bacterium]|nr:alpha-galactosidase [Clostridia bacterium]
MNYERLYNFNGWDGISDAFSVHSSAGISDGNQDSVKMTSKTEDGFVSVHDKFKILSKSEIIGEVQTRTDTFVNTSDEEIHISDYRYRFAFPGDEYEVFTVYNNWCYESRGRWQELNTEISSSSKSPRVNDSHAPILAIFNKQTGRGISFHVYANCSWKITARKQSPNNHLIFTIVEIFACDEGLDLVVGKAERFEFPKVAFYEFENKNDLDAHKLHKYLAKTSPRKPLPVIYNTWLAFFDYIDYDNIIAQIPHAAEIGCDYFTLDAGWFGDGSNWFRCVGDWTENKNGGYFGKMRSISDEVHKHGMKFGLWLEPERAVVGTDIVKKHPEYFFGDNGFSCFLDYSNSEALKYITDLTFDLIEKYNIDFFKFDFNDSITYDYNHKAFFEYHRGFEKYICAIREKYPEIYIEGCGSGGFVMSIGNMKNYDSVWITDNQSLYETLRIYKDSLCYQLPCFMEKWTSFVSVEDKFRTAGKAGKITHHFSTNNAAWTNAVSFRPGFLDGFFAGSPIGISTDLTEITSELRQKIKDIVTQFKEEETFWRNASCRIVSDTEKVLALQYENGDTVKLVVFIGKPMVQYRMILYPEIEAGKYTIDGRVYDGDGISLELPKELESYVFKFERVK